MKKILLITLFLQFTTPALSKEFNRRQLVQTVINSIRSIEKQSSPISHLIRKENIDIDLLNRIFFTNKPIERINSPISFSKTLQSFDFNLHLNQIKLKDLEDDLFQDDIYLHYVITNGTYPLAKTTSVYKNNQKGDVISLTPSDRQIFPLREGLSNKTNGLIIDITVFESDGDDIEELKKITDIIIDLVFLAQQQNETKFKLKYNYSDLRDAIKTLASLITQRNHDDNLKTFDLVYRPHNFSNIPTYSEFRKVLKGHNNGSRWEYILKFRRFLSESI